MTPKEEEIAEFVKGYRKNYLFILFGFASIVVGFTTLVFFLGFELAFVCWFLLLSVITVQHFRIPTNKVTDISATDIHNLKTEYEVNTKDEQKLFSMLPVYWVVSLLFFAYWFYKVGQYKFL